MNTSQTEVIQHISDCDLDKPKDDFEDLFERQTPSPEQDLVIHEGGEESVEDSDRDESDTKVSEDLNEEASIDAEDNDHTPAEPMESSEPVEDTEPRVLDRFQDRLQDRFQDRLQDQFQDRNQGRFQDQQVNVERRILLYSGNPDLPFIKR